MAITSEMSLDTSKFSNGMQKAKQEAKQATDEISKVGKTSGNEMDQVTGKIHAAGSSLKDFGSAFQEGGSKIAAIAGTALAVITAIVKQFSKVKGMLNEIDEIEANMAKHSAENVSIILKNRAKAANETASKIGEILKFQEKDKLSNEENAKLNLLKRDVQQGLNSLHLQEKIRIFDDEGNLLGAQKLAVAQANLKKVEKKETVNELNSQITSVSEALQKVRDKQRENAEAGIFELYGKGLLDTIGFGDASEYVKDVKSLEDAEHVLFKKLQELQSELKKLKQSTPATDTLALAQGRQQDLEQKRQEEEAKKIIANLNAEQEIEIARELDPAQQKRLEIERWREEKYSQNIAAGMDESKAKENADVLAWRKLYDLNREEEKKANALSNSLKEKPSEQILSNELIKQGAGIGIQTTDYSKMTMDLVKQIKEQMNKMLPYMAKVSGKL